MLCRKVNDHRWTARWTARGVILALTFGCLSAVAIDSAAPAAALTPTILYQAELTGGVTTAANSFWLQEQTAGVTHHPAMADPTKIQSSAADLILPAGSTIVKAFLEVELGNYGAPPATPISSVQFKAPGASAYTLLHAALGTETTAVSAGVTTAQLVIDITSRMNGYVTTSTPGGNASGIGTYTLANPLVEPDSDWGGWSIVTVYSNPKSPLRQVTVASALQPDLAGGTQTVDLPNIHVPSVGPVMAVAGMNAVEGDLGANDTLGIGKTGGTSTIVPNPFNAEGAAFFTLNDAMNNTIAMAADNNVTADGGADPAGACTTARNPYNGFTINQANSRQACTSEYDDEIFDAYNTLPASSSPISATLTHSGAQTGWTGMYFLSVDLVAPILTKSISPPVIADGGTATYTWKIDNTTAGNLPESGIGFTDALPAGLKIATPPNVVVNGTTGTPPTVTAAAGGTSVTVAGLNVAANSTATVSVDVTNVSAINPSCATNPPAFTNTAGNVTITSSNAQNSIGNVCLVVEPSVDLSISKTDNATSYVAGTVSTYTLSITNNSTSILTSVTVSDDLKDVLDDATFGTITGDAIRTGDSLVWNGALPVSATPVVVTYTVTVNDPDAGNGVLTNAITDVTDGGNCPGADTGCSTTNPVDPRSTPTPTPTPTVAPTPTPSSLSGGQATITSTTSGLAFTGSDVQLGAIVAVLLLGLGALVLVATRRRRQH